MVQTSGSTVTVEAGVWLRTSTGWQRALNWSAATSDEPAVWEVSVREDTDGQMELGWLSEDEVGEVLVTAPEWRPTKRDHVTAMDRQAEIDVARARARLLASAPRGWSPRAV